MRTVLLVFVAICWAGVAVDAIVHLAMGDFVFPASLLAVFAIWLVLWREHNSSRRAAQPVEAQR
jgi:hypothetical protein